MRLLPFVFLLALAGCEVYDYSGGDRPYVNDAYVPDDSGPGCDACPASSPWGQSCGAHQLGTACLYNSNEVCACISYSWRCGVVSGIDAGVPDAAIPPDAPQ